MVLRSLALLALVASFLVGTSTAAYACSCADLTPAESVGHADTVFTGTVTGVRESEGDPLGPRPPIVYTFRADNVYKGAPAAELTLATSADSASCGYPFERGTRYLVFATSGPSGLFDPVPGVGLTSNLCSGNVPVDPGTGPLRPGDERTTNHESLAGPVNTALLAALGTPSPVTPSPVASTPATSGAASPTAAAGGDPALGPALTAGGVAAALLLLAGALILLIRRRPTRKG
ncbi:hypothetical protein ACBJ59_03530 [Nonomuraea sp. MTCD27]|uniref:hypothetical protein n=1 Tax=Nonomuraea sp. MTCD27 TaxID=1676747 RepID=UPI0035C23049